MPSNTIQWFPGHMAKTRRMMKECMPQVDIILELLDARIPASSRNPEIEKLTEGKPRITLLTKSTLANPELSKRWAKHYNSDNVRTVIIDSAMGLGMDELSAAIKDTLSQKIERYRDKGMEGRR